MKKFLIIALLGVSAVVCLAQANRFPPINLYTGDPTGNACAANLIQQSSTTGLIYTCQNGTMHTGGATGNITPSPRFSMFYQPTAGTAAAAQGDPNITTDGAGHLVGISAKAAIADKGGQVFNVKAYGCVGDGITDDTTCIQAAIDAAAGSQVFFPAGNYLYSALSYSTNTTLAKGLKLQGSGMGQTTLTSTVANGYAITISGSDPAHPFVYALGGYIRDMTLTTTGSPANAQAISILSQWSFYMERVFLTAFTGPDVITYPLRNDISSNPDVYASINNVLDGVKIESNFGTGYALDKQCGLCAAAMTVQNSRINANQQTGVYEGSHSFHYWNTTISGNGGIQSQSVATCTGGGMVIDRVSTNPITGIIEGDADFDSNCLFHIWVKAGDLPRIRGNRFVAHANGAVWSQWSGNVPNRFIILGLTGNSQRNLDLSYNYARSDPVVAGVPNSAVDSSVAFFQIDTTGTAAGLNFIGNQYNALDNTGNFLPFSRDGGGMISCVGTGTPACTILQGGYYAATPTLTLPSTAGCTGVPTVTLTSHVITSINASGVTGCASSPLRAIISAQAYPANNSSGNRAVDNISGTSTGPAYEQMNGIQFPIGTPNAGFFSAGNGGIYQHDPTGSITQRYCAMHAWTDNANYQAICLDYTGSNPVLTTSKTGTGGSADLYLNGDTNVITEIGGVPKYQATATDFGPTVAGASTLGGVKPWADAKFGSSALIYFHFDTSSLTTNRVVHIPDATTTNTVVPQASATAGQFVTNISNDGVQHLGSPGGSSTVFALTAPVSNTGSTGAVQIVNTAKVPAGTMSATGKITVYVAQGSCTAAGVPYAGCAGANTGTCTLRVYLGTTNSALTTAITASIAVGIHLGEIVESSIRNQNSTSAQQVNTKMFPAAASPSIVQISPTALNTASDFYVNATMQNSVNGDICSVDQLDIVNWP